MTSILDQVDTLFGSSDKCILVRVSQARGSTPREAGAWMLVGNKSKQETTNPSSFDHEASYGTRDASLEASNRLPALVGTIGGGQLEFLAIKHARKVLEAIGLGVPAQKAITIPLGPEIGQCCGGRVELAFDIIGPENKSAFIAEIRREFEQQPTVHVFGAGHVGAALVQVLSIMPVNTVWIDTRPGQIEAQYERFGEDAPSGIEAHTAAVPELHVREANPGSAFVIMTHDHGLDYLITLEALKRGDAAYVGLIGSATKRTTFKNWLLRETGDDGLESGLICPIGNLVGSSVVGKNRVSSDKRPEIIALGVAHEIMMHFASFSTASDNRP